MILETAACFTPSTIGLRFSWFFVWGVGWGCVRGQVETGERSKVGKSLPDPALSAELFLPEDKQKYLWDIEHLALVMTQDVVPVFRRTFQQARTKSLLEFLAPEFRGRLFAGEGIAVRKGPVSLQTWREGQPLKQVDAQGFVEALLSYGKAFSGVEQVGIHFTTLVPEKDGDLEGSWTTQWEIDLKGALKDGGRAQHRIEGRFRLKRLSEDIGSKAGWIDSFEVTQSWFASSPYPLMEEITDATGIAVEELTDNWKKLGPPYYAVNGRVSLTDLDRDGRTDFVIFDYPTSRLFIYRGLGGGKFEDITEAAGITVTGSPMVVADLDNDGFEDLVLRLDERRLVIYRNRGNGTFEWLAPYEHSLNNLNLGTSSPVFAVADYDGDGLLDLYIGQAGKAPRKGQQARWIGDRTSPEGLLLRNQGNWKFQDVSAVAGLSGENIDTLAAVCSTWRPDGDPDLFLANHMGHNVLWENRGDGTFAKLSQAPGFGGFSMGATAGDLDGDGDPDLYVANMYSAAGSRVMGNLRPSDYPQGTFEQIRGFITGNELYRNDSKQLRPIGATAQVSNSGWAYGPAVVDLDGDGALDLYSPSGYQSVSREEPDG